MSFELQMVFKTSLLLLGGAAIALLLKRASASVRHAIWVLTFLAILATPIASLLLPPLELPLLQEPPLVAETGIPVQAVAEPFPPLDLSPIPAAAPVPEEPIVTRWSLRQWIAGVWALGAVVVFAGWLMAVWELRKLSRNSMSLCDNEWKTLLADVARKLGVQSPIQLRMSSEAVPPMTWGVFRPVILLPHSAEEWLPVRRRMVLEHEIAHVKRRDGLSQAISQVVCSLYWFNPLVWYAAWRLRVECERACDDIVLCLGTSGLDYADHLVDIARGLHSGFARAAISMAHSSQLKSRVLAILDAGVQRRRLSYRGAVMSCVVIGLLTISTAAVRVTTMASLTLSPPAFAASVPAFAEPQTPPAPPQLGPTGTGDASINGRVISVGTSDSVRGARVILNTDPISESPLVATADENGRFEFHKVSAGKYQLLATHEGYVRGLYGQRSPYGPGTGIAIATGQSLNSLVILLTPTGSISGNIRNRFGEPVANVAVRALKIGYQDGRRTLSAFQMTRTNDLGDYRLYYLEPGRYVISALPPEGPIQVADNNGFVARLTVLPGSAFSINGTPTSVVTGAASYTTQGILSASETGETYVPLYFPGVADLSAATQIELKPGGTIKSTDFVVSEVRAVRIRGQVRDANGQPVKGMSITLVPEGDAPAALDRYGTTKDDGSFELKGIPPGGYDLVASSGNLPGGISSTLPSGVGGAVLDRTAGSISTAADPRLMGRTPLRVGNTDIENVALTLRPGLGIHGRMTVEGLSASETATMLAGLAVQLIPSTPPPQDNDSTAVTLRRSRSFSMMGAVAPDGEFRITGAFPGVYRIAIRGAAKLPPGAYVKSARIDGVDVVSPRFILETEPRGELEIILGMTPGALRVSVSDEKQAPATAATVVLVPDSTRRQRYELYVRAVTDSAGKALLDNIPPGDYQAYAWETIEDGAWWDPEFLAQYGDRGKSVRIAPGGAHDVELKSIR